MPLSTESSIGFGTAEGDQEETGGSSVMLLQKIFSKILQVVLAGTLTGVQGDIRCKVTSYRELLETCFLIFEINFMAIELCTL